MYCTGGVRCERASAFMRFHGVENVYQLDGGSGLYLFAAAKILKVNSHVCCRNSPIFRGVS